METGLAQGSDDVVLRLARRGREKSPHKGEHPELTPRNARRDAPLTLGGHRATRGVLSRMDVCLCRSPGILQP